MSARRSTIIHDKRLYPADRYIFKQGDAGDSAYVIQAGRVGIYRRIGGLDVKIGEAREGEIFGEMAVIDGAPRMASAKAENSVTVIRIPKSNVEEKIAKADPFIRGILSIFMRLIRQTHDNYVRRPRSLADSLLMIDAYASGIAEFTTRVPATDASAEMAILADNIGKTVLRMKWLAGKIPDRRESVIQESDQDGASLREALGSE